MFRLSYGHLFDLFIPILDGYPSSSGYYHYIVLSIIVCSIISSCRKSFHECFLAWSCSMWCHEFKVYCGMHHYAVRRREKTWSRRKSTIGEEYQRKRCSGDSEGKEIHWGLVLLLSPCCQNTIYICESISFSDDLCLVCYFCMCLWYNVVDHNLIMKYSMLLTLLLLDTRIVLWLLVLNA